MSKKKKTMWVGGGQLVLPEPDVTTLVNEVVEMVPAVLVADPVGVPTAFTIEAIYLHFSTRRVGIAETQALGFLVWVGNIQEQGESPVQALDALSVTARAYSNKNIMMMAPLEVPPIALSGDLLTATSDLRIQVAHHEYQASRKFDRSNQVLCMTINSETALVVETFAQWRVLLEY